MANQMNEEKAIEPESTAWYEKEMATFADFLKVVRKQLWKDSSFFKKAVATASGENDLQENKPWLDLFVESLSRIA